MEFDNRDKAYQFYLAYSLRVGFGVRKRNANKKKDDSISSCRLVCCKEGVRNKEKKMHIKEKFIEPRLERIAKQEFHFH